MQRDLRNTPPARAIVSIAIPVMGSALANIATIFVDAVMCSRLPDTEVVLVALGFSTHIFATAHIIIGALRVGVVIHVSRAFGARQLSQAGTIVSQCTQLFFFAGAIMGVLGYIFAPHLLRALGASGEVEAVGTSYLRILFISMPFTSISLHFFASFRGVGSTRLPFIIGVGVNVINIALNYWFIFGGAGVSSLGVKGAALGTVLAKSAGVVAFAVAIHRRQLQGIAVSFRPTRPKWNLLRKISAVSSPAILSTAVNFSTPLLLFGLLGYIDTKVVAAHTIGVRAEMIVLIPLHAFRDGTSGLIGIAYGARDNKRVRSLGMHLFLLEGIAVLVVASAIYLGATFIAQLFDVYGHDSLFPPTVECIGWLALAVILAGPYNAIVGFLNGVGKTRSVLKMDAIRVISLIFLATYLAFGAGWEETGIWLSVPCAFAIAIAYGGFLLRAEWGRSGGAKPRRARRLARAR